MEDKAVRGQELVEVKPGPAVSGLHHLLAPLQVVLHTLKTLSDIHNTKEAAFSARKLLVPSKRPPADRRRKRKLPIKINKRPKQRPKPRPVRAFHTFQPRPTGDSGPSGESERRI